MNKKLIIERLKSLKVIADNFLDEQDFDEYTDREIYTQVIEIYEDGINNLIEDIDNED